MKKLKITSYKLRILKMSFLQLATCNFLLTSCGFQPMYVAKPAQTLGQNQDNTQDKLELVEIASIPNHSGQYLRNALIDRFYRTKRPTVPQYVLNVSNIQENIMDLDITKNSNATRGQLRLDTKITLIDKNTKQVVLDKNLRSITSYNILTSEFANRVSKENTRQNALDDLAHKIELQVGLYFHKLNK